ncbi:MAG TPA: FHA domain-containing protein [Slackia equolifaciens]|uniref:FHA domain-containing protein n=1 Tax=Slackia equolifaciens TaxID=498718 RepID=A0A9D3A1J0_9ACTN|nr:FHA domain-containing protein [Slackia equolifaciens]
MTEAHLTPCGALFAVMKKHGGMSYKELASLVLSGKPLTDGRSPASRVSDRTWVSRFIVHAPVGSLQDRYFSDFGVSSLRIVSRLKAREKRALSSEQILGFIVGDGGTMMKQALSAAHQDVALYDNVLARLIGGAGYTNDERVEIAMTLFVAAGCTADVRKAARFAVSYAKSVHGDNLATTPAASLGDADIAPDRERMEHARFALGLVRVVDGYVKGDARWVSPDSSGIEIGALALGEGDIADVGPRVSGRHAHVWCDEGGRWFVEDLGSRNGTVVVSGVDRGKIVVAPPKDEKAELAAEAEVEAELDVVAEGEPEPKDAAGVEREVIEVESGEAIEPVGPDEHIDAELAVSEAVEIHPGDELILAGDTVFALVAGLPEQV